MPQVCALLDNDTYELLADEAKKRDVKRGRALALITKEYFAPDSREHEHGDARLLDDYNELQQNMLRKEKDLSKLQNNLALKEEIIKLRDMQIDELQTNLNYLRHENSVLVARIPLAVPRAKPLLTRIRERLRRPSLVSG
ncbi:MAG: hypothetical protein WCE81_06160 [Halobacteriota archaeon]